MPNISSVDRSYRKGKRYLFVPYDRKGDAFQDNGCTDTQPWKANFNQFRPAKAQAVSGPPDMSTDDKGASEGASGNGGATEAEPTSADTGTSPVVWIAGGVVLALLALGSVILLRRGGAAATST